MFDIEQSNYPDRCEIANRVINKRITNRIWHIIRLCSENLTCSAKYVHYMVLGLLPPRMMRPA